jgi:hypothetical protein
MCRENLKKVADLGNISLSRTGTAVILSMMGDSIDMPLLARIRPIVALLPMVLLAQDPSQALKVVGVGDLNRIPGACNPGRDAYVCNGPSCAYSEYVCASNGTSWLPLTLTNAAGNTALPGNVSVPSGNVTVSNGNVTVSNGNVSVPTGNVAIGTGTLSVGNTVPNIIGASTFYAQSYAGVDASAKINACISAAYAAVGGTCDARALNGVQTMSQQITVSEGVALILPQKAHWNWSITDGSSCGIYQQTGSSVIGTSPGGGGGEMLLGVASSATSMDSLWCSQGSSSPSNYSYIYATGFSAQNQSGATFANGLIHAQYLWDESRMERVTSTNATGAGWVVDHVCCGVKFDNIQAYGSYTGTTAIPFTITNSYSMAVTNSTINAGAPGQSNLVVGAGNSYLTFLGLHMEALGTDTTTPVISINSGATWVHFFDGFINATSPKPLFSSISTTGFLALGLTQQNYFSIITPAAVRLQNLSAGSGLSLAQLALDTSGNIQIQDRDDSGNYVSTLTTINKHTGATSTVTGTFGTTTNPGSVTANTNANGSYVAMQNLGGTSNVGSRFYNAAGGTNQKLADFLMGSGGLMQLTDRHDDTSSPTVRFEWDKINGWFSVQTAGAGVVVKSPNGSVCEQLGIDNTGALLLTPVTCP